MANARGSLKESADFARGGGSAAPDHDSDLASRRVRLAAEQSRLIQWAEANGKLGFRRTIPEFGRGGEHVVYFHRASQRYFKATRSDAQLGYGIALGSFLRGATPSEYLDRLELQNSVFGDDIRLDRVIRNNGKPIIITSQPAVEGVEAPAFVIDALMLEKGYEKLAEGAFYDGRELFIFDLFPRNVIQTTSGDVFPIDPVIQRVTPEFAAFLRSNPTMINRGT
jgi:hypothetical protein